MCRPDSEVAGIDGLKVKAYPVTDKDGKPLEGGYKALLKIKFRKETWEMAEKLGFSHQFLLLWTLEKSGIKPDDEKTKAAYEGA